MVNHKFRAWKRLQHIAHRTQLRPSTSVEHNQTIGYDLLRFNLLMQHFNNVFGVDKRQIWWRGMSIDDADIFAQLFQQSRHAQFASQCIAIRANVAG